MTDTEEYLLYSLLPDSKTGYKSFKQKLSGKVVVGHGRFGGSNLVLGNKNDKPDLDIPSTQIFAFGHYFSNDINFNVVIHEEDEEMIEVDLGEYNLHPNEIEIENINFWTYSTWIPGESAPGDSSAVREVPFAEGNYCFVIAPGHKRIWLNEKSTGINYIIPITNYFNELMLVKGIKDPKIALNVNRFFDTHKDYSDNDIILGFLSYNRYLKRINIDNDLFGEPNRSQKKSFFSIFKKRRRN